ncbi:MAG: MFS transporter [Planctomycetota bacterium]
MGAPAKWRNELYPLGFVGLMFSNTLYNQWVRYYYAPPPGKTSPGMGTIPGGAEAIAALLLLSFLLQAALNPVIGQWADRTRTRWGRRRPFVLLGALPLAALFLGLFLGLLPGLVAVPVFGALFVVVIQPYMSLLPSVARDERMRMRLSLTGGVLALLAVGAAFVSGPKLLDAFGFPGLAWAGAGAIFALLALPGLVMQEAPPPAEVPPWSGPGAFAAVVRESGILRFLVGNGLLTGALVALTIASPYVAEALLGQPRAYTAELNRSLFAGMILSVPVLGLLVPRIGASRAMQGGAALGALVLLGLWFLSGDPAARVPGPLWSVGFGLFGLTTLAAISLPPLVIARYADADGRGREGLFFGSNGLAINVGQAVAAGVASLLLSRGAEGVREVMLADAAALALAIALIRSDGPPLAAAGGAASARPQSEAPPSG